MGVDRANAQPETEPARVSAPETVPRPGLGLGPAAVLALQRSAGNRAVVQALQRYALKAYTRTTWRQADDMSFATRDGYPNHELWAKPGKAAKSNTALGAVKSDIELVETGKEDTFWTDDKSVTVKLRKIEAKNKVNGTQGDSMLLYADCGRSASVVVGNLKRQAVFKDSGGTATVPGAPVEMKTGIMKKWLPKEKMRKLMVEANKVDADAIQAALDTGAKREAELGPIATRWRNARTELMKEAISTEYGEKQDEAAEAYFAYYNSRSDAERQRIDRELGINWYARPTVGQGYTTSTGGAPVPGADMTWNFHWSGVVMTSDDTRDNVVIENYSVSNWDTENNDWTFETYGTRKSDQTFHGQHQATKQHGESPTTMVIENTP